MIQGNVARHHESCFNWRPRVEIEEGLLLTIRYFEDILSTGSMDLMTYRVDEGYDLIVIRHFRHPRLYFLVITFL